MNRILKASLVVLFISIFGNAIDYSLNIFLAHFLTPSQFGNFTVAVFWAIFWSDVILLGGDLSAERFLPTYRAEHKKKKITGLIRYYFYLIIALGIIIPAITTLLAYIDVEKLKQYGFDTYHPLIFSMWIISFLALIKFLSGILRSYKFYYISMLTERIIVWVFLFGFIWIFYSFTLNIRDWDVVFLLGAAVFFALAIQIALVFLKTRLSIIDQKIDYDIKPWMNISIPIMLHGMVYLALLQCSLIMIEIITPNESDVGFFSAAFKIVYFFHLITGSVGNVMHPLMGPAIESRKQPVLQRVYNKYFGIDNLLSIPLLLIIIFFGKALLGFFGPEYVIAYPTLSLLILAFYIIGIGLPALEFLQFAGYGKMVFIYHAIALALTIILNFIFITDYGIIGSAYALLISFTPITIINFIFLKKKLSINPLPVLSLFTR